jgi:transcriptional regulator with XRE-family HTH domain
MSDMVISVVDGLDGPDERKLPRSGKRVDYPAGNGGAAPHALSCRMSSTQPAIGGLLRDWRQRRRLSQLDLALDAEISARHLSFLETGRARPSRDMVMRLSEVLDVPLRERNALLLAAGFAPAFGERPIESDEMEGARVAITRLLNGIEPNPAVAVDRHWNMVVANGAFTAFLAGISAYLLKPPANVLRISLHPDGMASQIVNFAQWRAHILERLRGQIAASGDPVLVALRAELEAYPLPDGTALEPTPRSDEHAIAVPLSLRMGQTTLNFISTTTIFGTPVDVTLSELAIESFFPADGKTSAVLADLADAD